MHRVLTIAAAPDAPRKARSARSGASASSRPPLTGGCRGRRCLGSWEGSSMRIPPCGRQGSRLPNKAAGRGAAQAGRGFGCVARRTGPFPSWRPASGPLSVGGTVGAASKPETPPHPERARATGDPTPRSSGEIDGLPGFRFAESGAWCRRRVSLARAGRWPCGHVRQGGARYVLRAATGRRTRSAPVPRRCVAAPCRTAWPGCRARGGRSRPSP